MTNPKQMSRKEIDAYCRELIHENKRLNKKVIKLELFLKNSLDDADWMYEDEKGD